MYLRDWRTREDLTLDQVAERLKRFGITVTGVSVGRYERFERMPDRDTLKAFIELTSGEVTANDFLEEPQRQEAVNV